MPIKQVFAGTAVTGTVTFKTEAGAITDPAVITISYRPGPNGVAVPSTYGVGGSPIVKVDVGIYSLTVIPPTSGPYGLWTMEAIGDGIVDVVQPGQFYVLQPSI
jgi:hypothetical protein